MKVYFLRHAQSEYNVKDLVNQDPKLKVSLTRQGEREAMRVAQKLRDLKIDIIFVSEFLRTQQTASFINKFHNVRIVVEKRITEPKLGFEGKSAAEYERAAAREPFNFKLRGYESWHDVVERVKEFLNFVKKQNYNCVLVVSHDWILRATNKIINNLGDKEALFRPFANCELLEFEL